MEHCPGAWTRSVVGVAGVVIFVVGGVTQLLRLPPLHLDWLRVVCCFGRSQRIAQLGEELRPVVVVEKLQG
jgi:hypothetical protein